MVEVAADNAEALEAWNGVLFDRFVAFRSLIIAGIAPHGDEAIRLHPPRPGDRVLDIGCGFGDSAQQLAQLTGPEGSVLGVDVAPRFIDAAREEAAEAGVENVRFEVSDVQAAEFAETFDYAFSRFGTMFLANPVPALDELTFRRCDLPIRIGHDLDEAVEFNLALGPAAEVVRLAGAEAEKIRPKLEALLREALLDFETDDGVVAGSSTWIVTARAAA